MTKKKRTEPDDILIKFIVDGDPGTKGRPRLAKSGRVYTPQGTKLYQGRVLRAFKGQYAGEPWGCPVGLSLVMVCKRPSVLRKRDVERGWCPYSRNRPDIDNCLKAVMDALNGHLYVDDRQVCEVHASKVYAAIDESPHIFVQAWKCKEM
jgi:Holliday junction resolvase RusA-like endonuclease